MTMAVGLMARVFRSEWNSENAFFLKMHKGELMPDVMLYVGWFAIVDIQ